MPSQCRECHEPLPANALGTVCVSCLNRAHLRSLWRRESEWLANHPDQRVYLATGVGDRLRHVVMPVDPRYTFCGDRVSAPRRKWKDVGLAQLPLEICERCTGAIEGIQLAVKELAAKGEK